ncbi:MAG: WD40 repeat domain-containing protein, partial [Blastocatellia bacterium]
SQDGEVRLWSLADGRLIKTLLGLDKGYDGYGGSLWCLAISSDGRMLATVKSGEEMHLWSLTDDKLIKTLKGHRDRILRLALSSDGRLLASGSDDKTVRLWTSSLIRLCELPAARASRADFKWVEEALRDGKMTESERRTLEFIVALMQWHRRFDIEIGEATRRIEVGEFDIEIEG